MINYIILYIFYILIWIKILKKIYIYIYIIKLTVGTASSWCFSNYTKKIEERDFNDGLYVKYFVNDLENALNEAFKLGLALPGKY